MTREQHWWQNTRSWRTRSGAILELDDLTPAHRTNILRHVTDRSLRKVRRDMLFDLMTSGELHDDAAADEIATIDTILDGPDEEILARMPLIVRLRELTEQAESEQARRQLSQERESARSERERRTARRIAERERITEDIRTLSLIAQENADRQTLARIRDHLASVLTSGDGGVSQLGHDRAVDLMRERTTSDGQ